MGSIKPSQGKGKNMSLVINHNMMAFNVARNLNTHYANLATSTERLSTGMRINSAADDAAGLAIRELQRADIAALMQGARNANDAISLIQVADGALSIIDEKLIRMRELAEQAATGTYSSTQRMLIDSEYQQMASEITRIANATDFNGTKLLDGSLSGPHDGSQRVSSGALKVHFGTGNDSAEDYYYIQIGDCTAAAMGVGNTAFELVGPRVGELTPEYYEELRDASAEKMYQNTYAEVYPGFYTAIYNKLVTGTPATGGEGIPAEEASKKAAEEAQRLADEYASQDREMAKAVMDKIYEDAFLPAYEDAYTAAITEGQLHAEADAAASKTATEAAIKEVLARSETVINDQNISSLTTPPDDIMPPRNREGADAFINQIGTQAYEAVYEKIYDELFTDAATKARAALGGGIALNADQVLAIHNAVDAEARTKATELRTRVENAMRGVYSSKYDGDGVTTGFEAYYNQELAAGNPPVVAQHLAEKKASDEGWQAMIDAMQAAAASGTPFGIAAGTGTGSDELDDDDLKFTAGSFSIDNIPDLKGGFLAPIEPEYTATADDVTNIYKSIGGGGQSWMDNHGLLGSEKGMVDTATHYVQTFEDDTRTEWVPAAGNNLTTQENAQRAVVAIADAIVYKDKIRAHLGALQNRFENTVTNLNIQAENLQQAESRISDVDVATEMTQFVRQQILSQSAIAMLAQANALPQMAMQLIGG